ncbi:MAG: tRNA (uridine(34)/cytosine(34)/5-carboxymethylaminomethyluridine(34)-2'-O)-methyltransferase TrmL [Eubacteriales bacterium]|nr:tRNA (uridine(34)/cytosine(34)/5-carboxymethylaminomethyluridine(34)-2'-O)-methyltransferase TrmL [Eubacteriales bacterium]
MAFHIVLVEPEIPQNTGNIARTCAVTGAVLHLVGPLGFLLDDKHLKRAGLDYWHLLDIRQYESFADFEDKNPGNYFFLSTKAQKDYAQAAFADGDYLIFGRETKGLPEGLLRLRYDRCVRIPMRSDARSLNLSNAVAIVLYEALRQGGFAHLQAGGQLGEY